MKIILAFFILQIVLSNNIIFGKPFPVPSPTSSNSIFTDDNDLLPDSVESTTFHPGFIDSYQPPTPISSTQGQSQTVIVRVPPQFSQRVPGYSTILQPHINPVLVDADIHDRLHHDTNIRLQLRDHFAHTHRQFVTVGESLQKLKSLILDSKDKNVDIVKGVKKALTQTHTKIDNGLSKSTTDVGKLMKYLNAIKVTVDSNAEYCKNQMFSLDEEIKRVEQQLNQQVANVMKTVRDLNMKVTDPLRRDSIYSSSVGLNDPQLNVLNTSD